MIPDIINSSFSLLGGIVIAKNCWQLYQDKELKGVSLLTIVFFTVWGFWNLYFYSYIDAWWSLVGGLGIVTANTIWAGQAIYYRSKNDTCGRLATLKGHDARLSYLDGCVSACCGYGVGKDYEIMGSDSKRS